MNRLIRSFLTASLLGAAAGALAQPLVVPLEFRQSDIPYNFQATRGVPISTVSNSPPGSDGRMPTTNESGSTLLPTTNQFRSFISFGAVPGYTNGAWQVASNSSLLTGSTAFSGAVAQAMGLPVGISNNVVVVILRRGQIGAPYLNRSVSFPFGSVVSAPQTDENGILLTNLTTSYWQPKPYPFTPSGVTNTSFYWSPHAGKVYASQPGPISITWMRTDYVTGQPTNYVTGSVTNYYQNGGNYFRLYTANYIVSGAPVKPPKKLYWTENTFRGLGKPVAVPTARVGAVVFAYNQNFPGTVTEQDRYVAPGETPPNGTTNQVLNELRTLWYDQGAILAYNREGRVFMELLGDLQPNGLIRVPLGFEIVDVIQNPTPLDKIAELGEVIPPPLPDPLEELTPEPVLQSGSQIFAYQQNLGSSGALRLYATRETVNQNDYLVHWMEEGVAGLKWPKLLGRYQLIWPPEVAKYSHYVRPLVATEEEAKATAVSLPTANAPTLEYQDPLDTPRGKLTDTFRYYTWLDVAHPAHRALLRFSAGEEVAFERVFSWLDLNLKSNIYGGSVATNLTEVADYLAEPTPPSPWLSEFTAPRVVRQTVNVGQRINAPAGEPGAPGHYLAGHINLDAGTSFDINAYIDPFVAGFTVAGLGAIIPVNAIPGANQLEVWWFRTNAPSAGANAANFARGFQPIYWPSALGRYTLQWPADPTDEIVLASNDGSGALPSLQAVGAVYLQNDRTLPGFNPNEEHALMQGGQAYALRDDLNITAPSATNYSSAPFVLLEYRESDNRPAMRTFKVLREKGADRFNYQVEAGAILQAPMPLPLMDLPLGPKPAGAQARSLNQETYFRTVASSTANGELTTVEAHHFQPWFRELVLQSPTLMTNKWFFATNADYASQALQGVVSDTNSFELSNGSSTSTNTSSVFQYDLSGPIPGVGRTVYVMAPESGTSWRMTMLSNVSSTIYLNLTAGDADASQGSRLFVPITNTLPTNVFAGWRLRSEPIPDSLNTNHGSFTFQDRKGNIWIYRGPHDANDNPWMDMQYYYKTLPGFFFPTLPLAQQPPAGTITPYLRNTNGTGGFVGDPVYGNRLNSSVAADNNALAIHYRPVWPAFAPVLQMAETLTAPKRGLPAVRGQTSLEVFYQQSQVTDSNLISVRLHDSTREKEFELGAPDGTTVLGRIPDSVKTETSRGKTYFPLLPPHLSERFFLDPNRGQHGKLVFRGEFVDEIVGDKYLNLNVLSVKDGTTLSNLCLISDPARARWNNAIAGLTTRMERFVESPQQPGTYVPAEGAVTIGPNELAEVKSSDEAVDSYALTAVGPGSGYVTLIAGNGRAFTPSDEPVSVLIMRVADVLYPGELKIITSPNPLAEKLTMQQVVDLAGQTKDYEFEWKIAAPVDGLPPQVYENTHAPLLGEGIEPWNHVPFPLPSDSAASAGSIPFARRTGAGGGVVPAVSTISFDAFTTNDGKFEFTVAANRLVLGNQVTLRGEVTGNSGLVVSNFTGVVSPGTTATKIVVSFDRADIRPLDAFLGEAVVSDQPQSIVFREFTVPANARYSQIWLSLDLDDYLGANVYLNGEQVIVANQGTNDTVIDASPSFSPPALPKAYRLDPAVLARSASATTQQVVVELFSQALPGTLQRFNLHVDAYEAVDKTDQGWLPLAAVKYPDGIRTVLGEQSDIQALTDNYIIMRYHATNSAYSPGSTNWSKWTSPQLAEGWIKRVLAGINPFNQRTKDLFNNVANTEASILTSAGHRWEGDVALNLESINNYGLIEIYETILRRGRLLSIDGGINYGPANDALLLAAGYLNDLYMMVGNEAWADAANPTIGIGTANQTYGDIATALFAFKGQEPSLLEEELALLRGRDDFLQPGVAFPPFYNRLVWNYTRGIDAGEVIYALNYNIQENPNQAPDGVIDAADAARMFPMGHGDAYGHYLTALKGYYSLLLNNNFDWVPRIEAVTVLGVPVSVDYQDERKFAAAAAALGRAGRQTFDLTWRKDYQPGHESGWSQFSATRVNSSPPGRTRYWGLDHWAARTSEANYLNWVVGNAILPAVDPNPNHEGIQKIDRTTVPELKELATMGSDLQTALDNAEGGLTPLGLAHGSLALDINPNVVVGPDNGTHFEQIYSRAKITLNNAVAAFDDAKDVTRLMRSEQDSLAGVQASVAQQELAYTNALIELYGTPYADDIGVGKTYKQGYAGPDLFHYMYVEDVTLYEKRNGLWAPNDVATFPIDIQDIPEYWANPINPTNATIVLANDENGNPNPDYKLGEHYIEYQWSDNGFMDKPASWTGKRKSPGKIQQAISEVIAAHDNLYVTITALAMSDKGDLDKEIQKFEAKVKTHDEIRDFEQDLLIAAEVLRSVKAANEIFQAGIDNSKSIADQVQETILEAFPKSLVVGLASGGDLTAPARSLLRATKGITKASFDVLQFIRASVTIALQTATETASEVTKFNEIAPRAWTQEMKEDVQAIGLALKQLQGDFIEINKALRRLDDANRAYQSLLAEGDRILEERLVFRQRTSAIIQGYRTRDAAFRIFRNEKLERYKTLFDLSARYSLLAANAYDYETGLLNTTSGREFMNRIVSARALGVVRNGEPQFAGSNLGDPGLSSALAEMKADWDVVKTRLGFNNPDAYGTTVSLRTENFRILPTTNSDVNWQNLLLQNRHRDLLADRDVQRHCLQISRGDGLPVPGIIIEFSTTIANGYNLFGQKLAAGDHAFNPSSFATKIFGVGAALEGYRGMDQPAANGDLGGITPPDPNIWYLDPLALAATPYVYLIPVGDDSMRSPPLGDASNIRSWTVDDVAIPLPFNIGASQLSSGAFYQSADFLSEPLFATRKHQAFRPVPSASLFSTSLYGTGGTLSRTQYTNNRLIGRSAWNSRWKLVIPGHMLLDNPDEGLERLVKSVRDVKLHFVTYSYSGN